MVVDEEAAYEELLRALEGDVLRKKYTQKERESFPLEDFGDPEKRAFPIREAEDVIHAAERLGEASGDKAAIKARIKKIAKRKGFPLPKTWEEEDGKKEDRSLGADIQELPLYMPIVRFDETNWTVTGQATIEEEDAYGTVFDYEASKRAFGAWRGNIREMHQQKAVGRAIDVEYDDVNKAIYVTARVSKGSKDTWEKVKDGTLSGFSVGARASKEDWGEVTRGTKTLPLLKNYTLAELSLVDNPATPGCNISIVRADGFASEVLAEDEPETQEENRTQEPTEQRNIPVSHVDQYTLHGMRDSAIRQAMAAMKACGCEDCTKGLQAIDPDEDGDFDCFGGMGDTDNDAGSSDMYAKYRDIEAQVNRAMAPVITRANGILAQMVAQNNKQPQSPVSIDTTKIEERLTAIERSAGDIAEVRSLVGTLSTALAEVKELAVRIAHQPVGGGPILNGGAAEKLLATQGRSAQAGLDDAEVIKRASAMGLIKEENAQVNAAAALIKIQQGY